MQEPKDFKNGGLNTDDAIQDVATQDYLSANNIRNTGTNEQENADITNIEGTIQIPTPVQSGLSKCIGAAGFDRIRKGYSLIYNSQGYNQLREFDYDTLIETVIFENLTNSGGTSILDLNPDFYVTDIKLIQDKYLCFNDGYGQPHYVNLERLKSGYYSVVLEEDLSLIKSQPIIQPTSRYNDDSGRSVNLLKNRLFQFREQFTRQDDEYSAWGTISKREVPTDEPTPSFGTDVTKANNLIVTVDAGNDRVKRINVASRYGLLDWFLIKSIDRIDVVALPDTQVDVEAEIYEAYDPVTNLYSFAFYNDGLYNNISVLETDLPYDYVPNKAGAMEVINGAILALGDLTEGYPRPEVDISLSVSSYDPQITITPTLPDPLIVVSTTNVRISGSHRRRVTITYGGNPKTGDKIKIQVRDIRNSAAVINYEYAVPSPQNNDFPAVLASLSTVVPSSAVQGLATLAFTTDSYYELASATIELQNAGTGASQSIHSIKDNSSYQLALAYYDKNGKYFPLASDERFVAKTASYAATHGLIPRIDWVIRSVPPVDAVSYQWIISENNTHQTSLYINGEYLDAESDADYLVFSIKSLVKFNETNSSSILNYEYSAGDRCTFLFTFSGPNSNPIQWFDTVAIDVEVVAYDVFIDVDDPANNTYHLKVRKSSALNTVDIINKETLLEVYTPKKRVVTNTSGGTDLATTLFYEIGERFDIIDGEHSITSGSITEADCYFKTRYLTGNIEENTLYSLLVEDFDFSDFYTSNYTSYGRPRLYDDEQDRIEKKASIRYSDTFVTGSKVNGITRFYGERIYGDGPGETSSNYGAIGKLRMRDNYLVCIQELKVGHIPVNMSIVQDQVEQLQYAISDKLLNFVRYLTGNFGIGKAKESYAESQKGTIYFADPNNSLPVRDDANNGLTVISPKMTKYFRRIIKQAQKDGRKIIGTYDNFNDEYNLTIEDESGVLTSYTFNTVDWELYNDYVINPATLAVVSDTNGTLDIDNDTGQATFTPDEDYVGNAGFVFSFVDSGNTINSNVCIEVLEGSSDLSPFYFIDLINQEPSTLLSSNSILIDGITVPLVISIVDGEYSINGGAFTSLDGTVNDGDIIVVRRSSSATYGASVSTTLTVGSYSDSFDITTRLEFGNVEKSGLFTKDDCETGVGSDVTYTVVEDTYFATTQIAADDLAQDDVDDNGQQYANDNGTCGTTFYYNAMKSGTATKNNCGSGLVGSTVTYTIPAATPAYTSTISQLDADNMAQAAVDAGKQAYANANGTCTAPGIYYNTFQSVTFQRNNCGSGQVGSFVALSVAAATPAFNSTISVADANSMALAWIMANGQANANTNGTCTVPSYFTLEVVIYSDYTDAKYITSDSRGVSFEFSDSSILKGAILVNTNVTRDSTIRTFSVPFSGSSVAISVAKCFLQLNSTSVSGSVTQRAYKNGSFIGDVTTSLSAGLPSGYQYTTLLVFGATFSFTSSDVMRIVHGTAPVSCDLSISYVSKTNETAIGANDGTITINGSTSYIGGFLLSKNGGASYPYTGTNPYTFTGLTAGSYNIAAINADGSCGTSLGSAIVISVAPTYYSKGTGYGGSTSSIACEVVSGGFALYGIVSGDLANGDEVYYFSGGMYLPYTSSSYISWTVGGIRVYATTSGGVLTSTPTACPNDSLFLSVYNDTTGTDCTIISAALGSEDLTLSLVSGSFTVDNPLDYTTSPIDIEVVFSSSVSSSKAFYYAKFYKNSVLIGTKSVDKSFTGAGSFALILNSVSVAVDDEIKIELTFQQYSELGFVVGDSGGTTSGEACAVTMGDTTLYSSATDGTLEVGDIALVYDASLYGKLIPINLVSPAPNNYISYMIGATRYWATVNTSTGEVLTQGTCSIACDLSISYVSKTNETAIGANDGTITINGSTSYIGGFLLSKNGGASYPYTGTNPYTFTGLAPGSYSIAAINADGSCGTSLPDAVVIATAPPSDAVGILVVDIFNPLLGTVTLDMCMYLSSGYSASNQAIYKNSANFLPISGSTAENCYGLASDPIASSYQYRFEWNIKKLLIENPSATSFTFVLRGRYATSGSPVDLDTMGRYSLVTAYAGQMTMTGSSGSYIPSVTGGAGSPINFNAAAYGYGYLPSGANGVMGTGIGAVAMMFTYNVASKTITLS